MSDLSILVVSCDKYADLWPIFLKLYEKNWRDCPWPLYIGSNYTKSNSNYETILIGEDASWCDNVRKMLDSIDSKYVLMLLEDFFIDRKVNTKVLNDCFQWMKKNDYSCLRLKPSPPPSELLDKKLGIGKLHYELPYFVSTQPAIWEKSVLYKLLKPGYSAWDFEQKNSQDASENYGKFAGTNKSIIHHKNGVERGNFYSSVIRYLNKEHISIEGINRGITDDEKIEERFSSYRYKIKDWIRAKLLYKCIMNSRKK